MNHPAKIVLLPVPLFLLELHSERMVDALFALSKAGFVVKHVTGTTNRFRIEERDDGRGSN